MNNIAVFTSTRVISNCVLDFFQHAGRHFFHVSRNCFLKNVLGE